MTDFSHRAPTSRRAQVLSLGKNVRYRHFQPGRDVLQSVQRDVLVAHLNPMQSGRGDAHFLLECGKRRIATRFLEERSKLFSELLTHV